MISRRSASSFGSIPPPLPALAGGAMVALAIGI